MSPRRQPTSFSIGGAEGKSQAYPLYSAREMVRGLIGKLLMLYEDTPFQTTFAVFRDLERLAELANMLVIPALYAPDSTRPISDACKLQKLEADLRESAERLKKYTTSSRYVYFRKVPKDVRAAVNTARLAFRDFLEDVKAGRIPVSSRKEKS